MSNAKLISFAEFLPSFVFISCMIGNDFLNFAIIMLYALNILYIIFVEYFDKLLRFFNEIFRIN